MGLILRRGVGLVGSVLNVERELIKKQYQLIKMKNNYVIKAFRISGILKNKISRAKEILNKTSYLELTQSDINRLSLNHFCDLVFSGDLNLKILKVKGNNRKTRFLN